MLRVDLSKESLAPCKPTQRELNLSLGVAGVPYSDPRPAKLTKLFTHPHDEQMAPFGAHTAPDGELNLVRFRAGIVRLHRFDDDDHGERLSIAHRWSDRRQGRHTPSD